MTDESKYSRTPSWRQDKRKTAERGYGGRWQRERAHYLKLHPLCVYCRQLGQVVAATVVDHIKPHEGDDALMWDQANWQSVCRAHHEGLKKQIEGRARRRAIDIDDDGWPVFHDPV